MPMPPRCVIAPRNLSATCESEMGRFARRLAWTTEKLRRLSRWGAGDSGEGGLALGGREFTPFAGVECECIQI